MKEKEFLKRIGLTDSESKVYLALLKIGAYTSKGPLLDKARIAPSKIYHVLKKLIDKGLVTQIVRNGVKHFVAAPPTQIQNYIKVKKAALDEEARVAKEILPRFEKLVARHQHATHAQVFLGWNGLDTAYTKILASAKRGAKYFVIGASKGVNEQQARAFYLKHGRVAREKKLDMRFIVNENSRVYFDRYEKITGVVHPKRYLKSTAPVETAVMKDVVMIVMHKQEPLAVLIHDKETAKAFLTYFKELWKAAKA